jgi:hypothetical protein
MTTGYLISAFHAITTAASMGAAGTVAVAGIFTVIGAGIPLIYQVVSGHNQNRRSPGRPAPGPLRRRPLTSPDLAHNWPTATGNGLPNRSGHAAGPASGNACTGPDLGFCVAGAGFEPA